MQSKAGIETLHVYCSPARSIFSKHPERTKRKQNVTGTIVSCRSSGLSFVSFAYVFSSSCTLHKNQKVVSSH